MGLCKCPKRKVTNLFCFEHRVNVCESCLVSSHESCVVQTYLSWLTDSDYDSNCILCTEPLSSMETVRLKCFHVFHWPCLNQRAGQLPNTTAPAGYKCPSCLDVIFPAPNQTSPVIEQLREKLTKVPWAAAGLNLSGGPVSPSVNEESNRKNAPPHAVVTIDGPADFVTARSKLLGGELPNPLSSGETATLENDDSPGAKYARKASERRSIRFQFSRLPRNVTRLLLVLVAIFILYYFLLSGERSPALNADVAGEVPIENPLFDPHANPNIRIQSNK